MTIKLAKETLLGALGEIRIHVSCPQYKNKYAFSHGCTIGIPTKIAMEIRMTTLNIITNFYTVLAFFLIKSQSLEARLTVKCASCHHMRRKRGSDMLFYCSR